MAVPVPGLRKDVRCWLVLALIALPALALLAGCQRQPAPEGNPLVLPGLAEAQDRLDSVRLRGPGKIVLVTLRKQDGTWRVAEQGDWEADAGRLSQYLFVLSQARRMEAKTDNPRLYPRLGVQDLSTAGASGSELELSGSGHRWRLLIGHEHPKFDSNYVRVDGHAQSWLTDLPVAFDRDPASWLDRRLIDLPLARILVVRAKDASGTTFSLSHRDDRFRLDDAPSAAMHESHQGDALASALQQLQFEQLASDDGSAAGERELRYSTVDGVLLSVQAWHIGEPLWVRLSATLDEARATAWLLQGKRGPAELLTLRQGIADWNQRFHGRRFRLPEAVAQTLMLDHEQILAGAPTP